MLTEQQEIDAWAFACLAPTKAIAIYVLDVYGAHIATEAIGLKDRRAIVNWSKGGAAKSQKAVTRMSTLAHVAYFLDSTEDHRIPRNFIVSSCPYIGDRTPMSLLAEDDRAGVLYAARRFLAGNSLS